MNESVQWRVLGVLVALWAILVAVRLLTEADPQRVPLTYTSGQVRGQEVARAASGFPPVKQPHTREPATPFREPKDIFAPLDERSEGTARTAIRSAKKPRASGRPPVAVTAPPAAPLPPTPEELAAQQARLQQERARQLLAQYRFLGYLNQRGESKVFLGKGRDLFIVRPGETLEGRILVTAVDANSVKLLDSTTSVEATLQLVKGDNGAS